MVTHDEGEYLAREFKMQFFETSALNNTNVDNAFLALVQEIKFQKELEASTAVGKDGDGKKGDAKGGKKLKATDTKEKKASSSSWC